MSYPSNLKIVDCTLRDGGYYVGWDFDSTLVESYLKALSTCRIDILEIGFRTFLNNGFYGAYAYTTDKFLEGLNIPKNINLAIMINAKEIINNHSSLEHSIKKLFQPQVNSKVEIVRIAFTFKETSETIDIANILLGLGYKVILNLMQIDLIDDKSLLKTLDLISSLESLECLYFADSFGNLDQKKIKRIVKSIRQFWQGSLGFHAHDNKGLAFANSLSAIEEGVDYIDGTILGMGRGAGNTKTENLVIELSKDNQKFFPDALFQLVSDDFTKLKEKYEWGPSIYYHLSAIDGIHPTYIQELMTEKRYDNEHILSAINFLRNEEAPVFSLENLSRAISGLSSSKPGLWNAKNHFQDKDVLIIGPGPKLKKYINEINEIIESNDVKVLCLNTNSIINHDMVDAYVTCHEMRIVIESDEYVKLNKAIIMPKERIPKFLRNTLNNVNIYDYGLEVKRNEFSYNDNGCTLDSSLSLAYAIAVASAGGAKRILLAGIDGYEKSDPRFEEVERVLKIYNNKDEAIPLVSITPTLYSLDTNSVFNPELFN